MYWVLKVQKMGYFKGSEDNGIFLEVGVVKSFSCFTFTMTFSLLWILLVFLPSSGASGLLPQDLGMSLH